MFAEELESVFDLIEHFPLAGEPVFHRRIAVLRRVLLSHSHYYLYYTVATDEGIVEILALRHTSRGNKPRL